MLLRYAGMASLEWSTFNGQYCEQLTVSINITQL